MVGELEKLKQAKSLRDVAKLLGYEAKSLSFILYQIPQHRKYTEFNIPKKSGGARTIKAPMPRLRRVQRQLAIVLTACSEEIANSKSTMKVLSHGFKKGHSIVTNAQAHNKRRYVFNLDLSNFFPAINFGRVRGFFIKNKDFKLHPTAATIIAQIACDGNELPQGSPCSPIISNLIGHLLDVRLVRIAKENGCTYSRYADDITFSSHAKKFPRAVARQRLRIFSEWRVGSLLKKAIEKEGFSVNEGKTRMQYRRSRQVVTGLVVNKKPNVKSEYYRTARAMCSSLFRTGQFYHVLDSTAQRQSMTYEASLLEKLWRKISLGFYQGGRKKKRNEILAARLGTMAELNGILSHIYYVKKSHDSRVKKSHNHIVQMNHNTLTLKDKEKRNYMRFSGIRKIYFRFLFYKNFYGLEKPLIVCEGKTDYTYLRCALKSLATNFPQLITIKDKKPEYHIGFLNYSNTTREIMGLSGGFPSLVTFIRHYKDNIKRYTCHGKRYPVIVLVDNDDAAECVFKVYREVTGQNVDDKKKFHRITDNLYILPIPKIAGNKTIIEHYFEEQVLNTKLNGKTLNLSNDDIDTAKEYGKYIFSEAVIKRQAGSINFNNFKNILSVICDVMGDYARL